MTMRGFFVFVQAAGAIIVQGNSRGFVLMWQDFAAAVSLVFVIEGILPFLSPRQWRKLAWGMAQLSDRSMRIMGLVSMLIGVGLLTLVRSELI